MPAGCSADPSGRMLNRCRVPAWQSPTATNRSGAHTASPDPLQQGVEKRRSTRWMTHGVVASGACSTKGWWKGAWTSQGSEVAGGGWDGGGEADGGHTVAHTQCVSTVEPFALAGGLPLPPPPLDKTCRAQPAPPSTKTTQEFEHHLRSTRDLRKPLHVLPRTSPGCSTGRSRRLPHRGPTKVPDTNQV